MKTTFNPQMRAQLIERLKRLTPEAKGSWGSMTAAQMIAHLSDALKMALGELPVKPKRGPLRYAPLKQLIIYVAPFPKGAPTAPELITRAATDWQAEVALIEGLLERFVENGQSLEAEHPAFGKMSRRGWGVLVYRHTDHHLRQFGV